MMELRSALVLFGCLSVILLLTVFINFKQRKQLKQFVEKQEPKFDAHFNIRQEITSKKIQQQSEFSDATSGLIQEEENLLIEEKNNFDSSDYRYPSQDHSEHHSVNKSLTADELIYFVLLAKPDSPYIGYELLQTLLSAGLRFGAMNIFHRHEEMSGRGKILFSVASVQEPGTFEINKMGGYSIKGLMMFLRFSPTKDLLNSFEIMLETAKQLIEDLGGEIFDDERQPLNAEKIEKWRKKILAFEQKQVIRDLFEQ